MANWNKTPFFGLMQESEELNKRALTPQQDRYSQRRDGPFQTYKQFVSGDSSLVYFLGLESYTFLLTNLPGLIGFGLRSVFLPPLLKAGGKGAAGGKGVSFRQPQRMTLGKNVIIEDYSLLDVRHDPQSSASSELVLGDSVYIGPHSMIMAKGGKVSLHDGANVSSYCRIASQGDVEIGHSVLIAAYCYIGPGNHRTDDLSQPIMAQGMEPARGVRIGKNSWIGTRSTILDGVSIGENAIVGAHSLVRDDVPDKAIVAGTPAKIIRYRE